MSFVREHFPDLAQDYIQRFATEDFTGPAYRKQMATRVRSICQQHGLAQRSTDALLTRVQGLPQKPAPTPASPARKGPTRVPETPVAAPQALLFANG